MKVSLRYLIFIILTLGIFADAISSDEDINGEAYFYENSTWRGYWGTKIEKDGVVVTKSNKNMLDFENKDIVKSLKLNKIQLDNLCTTLINFGFFNLSNMIAPGGSGDGPHFTIRFTCKNLTHKVDYFATSQAKSDKESDIFIKSWEAIGALMPIEAPNP